MNDEIEHLTGSLHRATQIGCRLWAPITPLLPGEKDVAKDRALMPDTNEDPMPVVKMDRV